MDSLRNLNGYLKQESLLRGFSRWFLLALGLAVVAVLSGAWRVMYEYSKATASSVVEKFAFDNSIQTSGDAGAARMGGAGGQIYSPTYATNKKDTTVSVVQNCVRDIPTVDLCNFDVMYDNVPNYDSRVGYLTSNVIHDACIINAAKDNYGGNNNLLASTSISERFGSPKSVLANVKKSGNVLGVEHATNVDKESQSIYNPPNAFAPRVARVVSK